MLRQVLQQEDLQRFQHCIHNPFLFYMLLSSTTNVFRFGYCLDEKQLMVNNPLLNCYTSLHSSNQFVQTKKSDCRLKRKKKSDLEQSHDCLYQGLHIAVHIKFLERVKFQRQKSLIVQNLMYETPQMDKQEKESNKVRH